MNFAALARNTDALTAAQPLAFRPRADLAESAPDPMRDLTADQRRKADERVRFVREVEELARTKHLSEKAAVKLVAARNDKYMVLPTAGKGGSSAMTWSNYRHWKQRLGKHSNGRINYDNAGALADAYARGPRERRGSDAYWQRFARLYLNRSQLSVPEAHSLAGIAFKRDFPTHAAGDIPTLSQVRYQVAQLDPCAVAYARCGPDYFRNQLGDWIDRDWSAVEVGSMWVGDHRQFDLFIRSWDEVEQKWKAVRPWCTAWQDARSGYVIGWYLRDVAPNAYVIEDALLNGIRKAGNVAPDYCYMDNGKDYLSRGTFTPVEFDGHEHSIGGELGTKAIVALPYNARAKLVERIAFGNFSRHFDKLFPSYLGHDVRFRDKGTTAFSKDPTTLLSLQQFTEIFASWLERFHETPVSGKRTGGASPAELWAQRAPTRQPYTDEQLYFAFLKPLPDTRQVGRGARIRVDNVDYQNYDELRRHIGTGQKFMIKRDLFHPDRIYVYHLDGRLVCRADAVKALPAYGADREQLSDRMRQVRRLEVHARTQVQLAVGQAPALGGADRLTLISPDYVPELPTAAAPQLPRPTDLADSIDFSDVDPDMIAAFDDAIHAPPEPDEQDQDPYAHIMDTIHREASYGDEETPVRPRGA